MQDPTNRIWLGIFPLSTDQRGRLLPAGYNLLIDNFSLTEFTSIDR